MGIKGKSDSARRKYKGAKREDSSREYVGGRRNNPVGLALRRKEAAKRQSAWSKLSPAEQLKKLDERLGKGTGAKRQRERLAKLIKSTPAEPAPKKEAKKGGKRDQQRRA